MELKKITAIFPTLKLEEVEKRLIEKGIEGLSITHVMGFGEYANFFRKDLLVRHVKIEIFTKEEKTDEIVAAIMDTVHTGATGNGIIAVMPVEKLYKIRTKQVNHEEDL